MSEWISVKDQMPSDNQMVIGYTPVDGRMFVGFYRTFHYSHIDKPLGYWYIGTAMRSTKRMTKKVTHWMSLPSSPKEEN